MKKWIVFSSAVLALLSIPAQGAEVKKPKASAANPSPSASAESVDPAAPTESEKVSVEAIKQKYWARGDETELGVVQNRLYSKARKFELGVFGGVVSTDPFLSVKNAGGTLGYHFTETWGARVVYWKDFVSPSSALNTFQDTIHATTNYNAPKYYAGSEVTASVLYGKLSLVGKAIIYYDFHLLGGLGVTGTDNGKYLTQHVGLGQQVYLSKVTSLTIDYRLMHYKEDIIEKVVTPRLGQNLGSRSNFTNTVTLGVSILFGPSGK